MNEKIMSIAKARKILDDIMFKASKNISDINIEDIDVYNNIVSRNFRDYIVTSRIEAMYLLLNKYKGKTFKGSNLSSIKTIKNRRI